MSEVTTPAITLDLLNGFTFYNGVGVSTEVPGRYAVAINGRGFVVEGPPHRKTVPVERNQADTSTKRGESTLNPAALWRSWMESWHMGAGQTFLDREDSDPHRFRTSKGVDPWTRHSLTLLPTTSEVVDSAATNLRLAVAGTVMCVLDGTGVKRTTDGSTWSAMTGTPGTTWKSLTSDGFYFYATDGSNVYRWERTATAVGAAWNTTDVDLLGYLPGKGRLMGALNTGATKSVYNITGSGAPTDIAPTNITSDFSWVDFTEGANVIYGAGYQGDKSLIFRWKIKEDGTGLDAAVPALPDGLPDGEIVRALGSYQGFIFIGTDKGARFATADTSGNLTYGPLIATDNPVRCFEGQESFVWFGMENYDSTSTGLGRMSLEHFTNTLTPAYASDLMATAQGQVLSVVTFGDKRYFSVSGDGVYAQSDNKVASGEICLSKITYGISDDKLALFADLRFEDLVGSLSMQAAVNDGAFSTIGVATSGTQVTLTANQLRGESFALCLTLNRSDTDATAGPTVTRITLRSQPMPARVEEYTVVAHLNRSLVAFHGDEELAGDPEQDHAFLLNLLNTVVNFQHGHATTELLLTDIEWKPSLWDAQPASEWFYEGPCQITLKSLT